MENRERGVGTKCASPNSPLPIPYSLFCFFFSANESFKLGAKEKLALTTLQKRRRNGDQRLSQLSM
jgi:hypothetical protein